VNMPLKEGVSEADALDLLKTARKFHWKPSKLNKLTGWSFNSCKKYIENPSVNPAMGVGAPRVLTELEENSFIQTVIGLNQAGFHITMQMADRILVNYCKELKIPGEPKSRYKQLNAIFKRHPQAISLQSGNKLSKERFNSVTLHQVLEFFKVFEKVCREAGVWTDEHGLDPSLVWNFDESGFGMIPSHALRKILYKGGGKFASKVPSDSKIQITTNFVVSMTGKLNPVQIVHSGVNITKNMIDEASRSNFTYCTNQSGWMTTELLKQILIKDILPNLPKPCVLLADNHSSHIDLDIALMCREQGVHVILLPPNGTTIFQALDRGLFGALKPWWSVLLQNFERDNQRPAAKKDFAHLLGKLLEKSTTSSIIRGWEQAGFYAYMKGGPEAVMNLDSITSKCVKNDKTAGYVAPKEKACKVRIGGGKTVLTRRSTPTDIATASTNAVLAEMLQIRKIFNFFPTPNAHIHSQSSFQHQQFRPIRAFS